MWNLVSICLVTVLVSMQDRCMVCTKRTIGSKIQGDEALVDAHFGLFGDRAHLDARWLLGLRRSFHRLENRFGRT
jgi:hypothetical protein